MEKIRLNKFLADSGISSRRGADKLIESGKVEVNSIIVREMGIIVDPKEDIVKVGGVQVKPKKSNVYYLLNKPAGYITTNFDPRRRKKVLDLVPSAQHSGRMSQNPRVFSVGRLDYDTRGLLILTNDGDLAYKLTHPKFEKEKEYIVSTRIKNKGLRIKDLEYKFKEGVKLKEGIAKADKINIISQNRDIVKFSLVIHQGWKRQIRRMCDKIGLEVVDLKRVRIGSLELGDLKEGEWRELNEKDLDKLFL